MVYFINITKIFLTQKLDKSKNWKGFCSLSGLRILSYEYLIVCGRLKSINPLATLSLSPKLRRFQGSKNGFRYFLSKYIFLSFIFLSAN